MTLPTWITLFRLILIPVFVLLAIHYGDSVQAGQPREWLRLGAIAAFVLASVSDFLDGYLARKLNLQSRIGAILDPIADKGLLIAALVTLTFSGWPNTFPLWFMVLVISRDLFILAGVAALQIHLGKVKIKPTPLGKLATAMLMVTLAWVMLKFPHHQIVVALAGAVTFASAVGYFIVCLRLLHSHEPHS